MSYSYNKLWKLMIDKKINKTTLRREAGITSNAMAKMGKDQPVSVEVLAKICRVLDCTADDVIEFLPDDARE
ncbi:MAG: helix-turn-helix transcriptional regulator [Oscillospiraceae bacterium]|nr:helix-turn-helix transcriptional regulator [Oscillospiraceae bacterium]